MLFKVNEIDKPIFLKGKKNSTESLVLVSLNTISFLVFQ